MEEPETSEVSKGFKEKKLERRTAKAAVTRACKAVRKVIGEVRPSHEVSESLIKLQNTFENLVFKHEQFAKLIENEDEFAEEEAWLDEVQEAFLTTEIEAKCYLEDQKEVFKFMQTETDKYESGGRRRNKFRGKFKILCKQKC